MIRYEQQSIKDILEKDTQKKLLLPNFQRDFVWKREKQKSLLASLLVGLPIGNILFVKGKKVDFLARELGRTVEVVSEDTQSECEFLLDGQQRISCLKSIFDDLYPDRETWKSSWDNVYGLLRNRCFLRMTPSNDEVDIWGWNNLRYLNNLNKYDPDQVEDFIVYYQILVKDQDASNAFFHPAFKTIDNSGNEVNGLAQRNQILASKYAEKGLVPLFSVFNFGNEPSSIHGTTLRKIANIRKEQIRAKVSDTQLTTKEILGHINDDVESITDIKELDSLWSQLASDWASDVRNAVDRLIEQKIIVTILPADEIARAASIFETINEGGTPLSNFDLIVAKTARTGDKSLSQELKSCIAEEMTIDTSLSSLNESVQWRFQDMSSIKDNSISKVVTDQFLNLLSLTANEETVDNIRVEDIKQKKILRLTPEQISSHYNTAFSGLKKAFAFLQFRCGVISVNDVIYKLMILPIGYVFAKSESSWGHKDKLNKIEYWYWLSLFSGRYRDRQNERCIEDVKSLYRWLEQNSENTFSIDINPVLEKPEYSDNSTLLMQGGGPPPNAVKNAIIQYVLSQQPRDFVLSGQSDQSPQTSVRLRAWEIAANNHSVEEHHIVPLSTATSISQSTKEIRGDGENILNSPLNLTLITKEANRSISDTSPSQYLQQLTYATIGSHLISQSMIDKTRVDSFQDDNLKNILQERFNCLLQQVNTELENLLET